MKNQKKFIEDCIKSYKDTVMTLTLDEIEGGWNEERMAHNRPICAFLQVMLLHHDFLPLGEMHEIKKHARERAKAGYISFDD